MPSAIIFDIHGSDGPGFKRGAPYFIYGDPHQNGKWGRAVTGQGHNFIGLAAIRPRLIFQPQRYGLIDQPLKGLLQIRTAGHAARHIRYIGGIAAALL